MVDARDRELQNLRRELARRDSSFTYLQELGARVASSLDLPAVLQAVVDGACELTGARYGALGVFDIEGRVQEFITSGMSREERDGIGDRPQGLGLLGLLHQEQSPLRLTDLTSHPRSVGFPPNHPQMRTFLGAPIRHRNQVVGNLYLTEKENGEEFTSRDEQLLELFGSQAALAINNAQQHMKLQESELRYRAITEVTPVGIFQTDADGKCTYANQRWCEIAGLSAQEAMGQGWTEGLHPEDRDRVFAEWQEAAAKNVPFESDHRFRRPDGTVSWVYARSRAEMDDHGAITGYVGSVTDVTERKVADDALRSEQQRLQTVIETCPVGVFVVEKDTQRVLGLNREANRILQLPLEQDDRLDKYEQAAVYRRPDGSVYESAELPIERALNTGEVVLAEEIVFEFADGRRVPTVINATPILGAEGQVTGAIAAIQDMSPLGELEKLRSEFLGIVSHELRTPLTAIKGSAATVLESPHPLPQEEVREFLEIINQQADRLRDLIGNLLDQTRIESGTFSVTLEPSTLEPIILEARQTFLQAGRPLEIRIDLPDDLPAISGDIPRLAQVLVNLFTNSAKFSTEDQPVTVRADHSDGFVTVRVEDRGRGIPVDKLPELFRKFSQVHEDGSDKKRGTGLGLAICKGIVEAHGGRIWAESGGDGKGTTISFTIPTSSEIQAVDAHPAVADRSEHLGSVRKKGQKSKVLAVDDEFEVLRFLRTTLNRAGFEPILTGDPSQVIDLLESEGPDLVLLDLNLPGSSGFALLERIREISGVPVIFLSASDSEKDTIQALKLGADDYITKPFSPSELLARMESALRRRVTPGQIEVRAPYEYRELKIDFARRRAILDGIDLVLTPTEYKLVYELATNAGRVLTHDQILQRVWGPEYSGEAQLIRAIVRTLRKKLGDDARNPRFVITEPSVGYTMPVP
jgi:PAS domain S-box-containing protein